MLNFFKKRKSLIVAVVLSLFITTMVFSPIISTQTAHSQGAGPIGGQPTPNPFNPSAPPPTPSPPTDIGPPDPNGCSWYDVLCAISKGWNNLMLAVAIGFLYIGSFLVGIAGSLLDSVIRYTIIEMSANVGVGGNLHEVISATWRAFRDLANLAFIFILLYIAIKTILGDGGDKTKRLLSRVIIVALLLNFSLFFTQIIVDASNILAVVFYNAIGSEGGGGNLGNAYMNKFGFTSWYDWGTAGDLIKNSTNGGVMSMLMFGFLGMLFMGMAAFVFFALSFFLIVRFVTIIFLFILSPLAFAAMALPKDEHSNKWIESLTDQVIFAPAMLALLWVSLKMLDVIVKTPDPNNNLLKTSANIGSGVAGNAATAGELFMNFFLVIAFTFGALIIAKSTGAKGAQGFIKVANKFRAGAQGYLGRGALRIPIPGIGSVASLDRKFADSEFGKSKTGRVLRSISTGALTNQSFGSGQSVQKVDKEVKKRNEEYVKAVDERVNKNFDKSLPELRKKAIEEKDKEIVETNNKINTTDLEIKDLESEIKMAGKDGNPELLPAIKADKEKQIKEKKGSVEKLTQERIGYEKERIGYESRMRGAFGKGLVATKEESDKWLRERQLEEARKQEDKTNVGGIVKAITRGKVGEQTMIGKIPIGKLLTKIPMPMSAHHKMAAKKIREGLRGGGKKDAKKLLEEVIKETGESSGSEKSDKPNESEKK